MSLNIVLSRTARNAVNSLVRNHPGFEAFRVANGGFDSRNMTKEILMSAIETLDLVDAVHNIVRDVAMSANTPENDAAELAAFGEGRPFQTNAAVLSGASTLSEIEMSESVMSPLRPFLSPVLLDTVSAALAPIVALAAKPPVKITTLVDADGNPVASPEAGDARLVTGSTLGKLFGLSGRLKHSNMPVSVWDATDAPAIDPFFVPDLPVLAKIVSAVDPANAGRVPRNVWLTGPSGGGKSSLPEQLAARSRRPFVAISFNRAVEPTDLVGMLGLDGKGGMKWRDGVLVRAIRKPGTYILLDELTFAPPGLLATLQTLLSSRKMTLPTGEVVECADGVVFIIADNTNGTGDESGLYTGTLQTNVALIDRAARMIRVEYLDAALETQALANHTQASHAACARVVSFVGSARKLTGFADRPLSLRRMVAFVEMCVDGFTVAESFNDTMLTRLPDAERETLRIHFRSVFDVVTFEAEMSGVKAPAGLSDAPEQIDARSVDGFTVIDPTN